MSARNPAPSFSADLKNLAAHVKADAIKSHTHNGVTWVDVHAPTPHTLAYLAEKFKLSEIHTDQCQQKSQVSQIDFEPGYLFLLFYFPYLIVDENKIATSQVNVFLGDKFIITVHDSTNSRIIDQLYLDWLEGEVGEARTPGKLLYFFIRTLLGDTTALVELILQELDQIEDRAFSAVTSEVQQIGQMRQKIIKLRRAIENQKSIFVELGSNIDAFTGERLSRHYGNNLKTIRKLSETIEEAKETIEIYKDADFITSTEKTNDILAVLTLMFTLTIPVTVIASMYGMNILLPGGIETGPWTLFGPYTMLIVILSISVIIALAMMAYFRHKKWF